MASSAVANSFVVLVPGARTAACPDIRFPEWDYRRAEKFQNDVLGWLLIIYLTLLKTQVADLGPVLAFLFDIARAMSKWQRIHPLTKRLRVQIPRPPPDPIVKETNPEMFWTWCASSENDLFPVTKLFHARNWIDFSSFFSSGVRMPPSTNCFSTGYVRDKLPKIPIFFKNEASTCNSRTTWSSTLSSIPTY